MEVNEKESKLDGNLIMERVSKQYKQKHALHPFSMKMSEGECVVLCGGNGAGKSTILNILAGISKPTTGTVVLNGIEMEKDKMAYVTYIGYMPDEFLAQGEMSVREFLAFYASLRMVTRDKIDQIITQIGLSEKQSEQVKALSKGMRQRLLLGQAILDEPDLLIMDEPTNGLDPFWINEFIELIHTLKKKGMMIIFSTHMMDVAAEVGDRIMFIQEGKLAQSLDNDGKDIPGFTRRLLELYRSNEG
ncbi:ABC transporter ATP-binding protein [Pradoshia sp.]